MIPFLKGKVDVEDTAKKLISGIDKSIYTKEERRDDDMESLKAYREWQISTLGENTVRSKARRFLAHIVMVVFLGMFVLAAAVYRIDKDYSKFAFEMAKDLGEFAKTVMLFYFGSHVVRTILDPVAKSTLTNKVKNLFKKKDKDSNNSQN